GGEGVGHLVFRDGGGAEDLDEWDGGVVVEGDAAPEVGVEGGEEIDRAVGVARFGDARGVVADVDVPPVVDEGEVGGEDDQQQGEEVDQATEESASGEFHGV